MLSIIINNVQGMNQNSFLMPYCSGFMLKVADVYSFIFLIRGWLSTNSTLYFPPSFVSGNYMFFLNSCLAIVLPGYHGGFPNTKNVLWFPGSRLS